MLLSVPHHQQVHRKKCLPACVQMVLEYQGVELSPSDIEALLQTEAQGTRLHNVDLLLSLPFVESITLARLAQDQLEGSLSDEFPPIVYVWTASLTYWHAATVHAVVVVGFDETIFHVNDPYFPESPKTLAHGELAQAWGEVDNWAAIIRCRRDKALALTTEGDAWTSPP